MTISTAIRRLAAVLALAWTVAAPVAAQTPFEPAVVVNDSVVTAYDVAQRARLLLLTRGAQSPEAAQALAQRQLVDDRIRLDAAREEGLRVPDDRLEAALADYGARRGLTPAQLDAGLAQAGVARETLAEALRAELVWGQVVRRRFGALADPSEAEIDQELAIASGGVSRSIRLQEIALPFRGRGEADTRALADRLVAELRAGGDFEAAARRHSGSPTAAQGGDVGWVSEGALPLELAGALAGAEPGAVVGPAPINGGLAVLRVTDIREDSVGEGGQDTLELALVQAGGPRARAAVAAIADAQPDCDAALADAQAAGLAGQRSEPTAFGALQPATREAIDGLEPGQNSGPIDLPGGVVRAFFLCSRVSGASPEAREALRERIRAERLQGFAAGYLQELRAEAVIDDR